ncbi:MAG: alginate export family protein [Candidatus Omnitrophica bacterium]|nr:alginate export family protein [Candidatus Omnitrophota bacterium]
MKSIVKVLLITSVVLGPGSSWAGQQPGVLNGFDRKVDQTFRPHFFGDGRFKMKIGGQSRYRYECRDDFNLNSTTYEDDSMHLLRNRLNLDVSYLSPEGAAPARFFAEGQEAHSFAKSDVNQTNGFVNELDLRQFYAELKSPVEELPLSAKIGRQVLSYGDERLVGGFEWSNVARVFDALKWVYAPNPQVQLDVFASRVVRVDTDQRDQTPHADNFYGIYLSTKPFRKQMDQILDSFLFIRHNRDRSAAGERAGFRGELKEYTFGNRFKGKKWSWDYGTEYAVQLGSRAHDTIAAWAFHQELGHTFSKAFWTPRIYGEYNHASGDRNPTNGTFSTFDNLFPTNHNKYGYIDFISLKNVNDFMVGTSLKPHARLQCSADFHWFVLDAKESAWFNAGGGVFRAANPAASPHLGSELDLLATYQLTAHLGLMAGYSRFFAGPFAKDTGAHDDANFLYFQTVFNF